jgi:hypothetical protein
LHNENREHCYQDPGVGYCGLQPSELQKNHPILHRDVPYDYHLVGRLGYFLERLSIKELVQVAAHTSAKVDWYSDGKLLRFS